MSNAVALQPGETPVASKHKKIELGDIENLLINGDLSRLSEIQRVKYVKSICESLGLNLLTRPFDFIVFKGKMVLYARKDCTEQLRKIHGVSTRVISRETVDGIYAVTVRAADSQGREDDDIGCVAIGHLKGEELANAIMRATTKAKRRATLSICGLGFLDESEIEAIPEVQTTKIESPAEIKKINSIKEFPGISLDQIKILSAAAKSAGIKSPTELALALETSGKFDFKMHSLQSLNQSQFKEVLEWLNAVSEAPGLRVKSKDRGDE